MTSPVRSVGPDVHLDEVHAQLVSQRISSMPVLDADGKGLGLVSYTDLLRIGRMQPPRSPACRRSTCPESRCDSTCTKGSSP
jgi:CBS-domain-containing membrane protein